MDIKLKSLGLGYTYKFEYLVTLYMINFEM
jgi:hypothetical protein